MESVEVGDHLAVDGDDHPPGVYRIVGTPDETVTGLRVGDADGRRVHSGEIVTIDRADLDGFGRTDAPADRRSRSARVADMLSTGYWSVRAFAGELRTRPIPSAVGVVLVLAGALGDLVVSAPEPVLDALVLLGGVGLAAIGSGRV